MSDILTESILSSTEEEFTKSFIEYLMKERHITRGIRHKIINMINKRTVVIRYRDNLFIRSIKYITKRIRTLISSNYNSPDVFCAGLYSYSKNKIFIFIDDKEKLSEYPRNRLILEVILHELVHYGYIHYPKKFKKIFDKSLTVFYTTLLENLNLVLPKKLEPAKRYGGIMVNFIDVVFDIVARKDMRLEVSDILDYYITLPSSIDKDNLEEWVEYVYDELIFNKSNRTLFTKEYRYSFFNAYKRAFGVDLMVLAPDTHFYQEFINISEPIAVISPMVVLSKTNNNVIKFLETI